MSNFKNEADFLKNLRNRKSEWGRVYVFNINTGIELRGDVIHYIVILYIP